MISLRTWAEIALVAVALSGWAYGGLQKAARASERAEVIATQLETTKIALRAAEASAERGRALSEKHVRTSDKLRLEANKREQALRQALAEHSDWADAPVPDSVWNALGYPAGSQGAPESGVDPGLPGR